jgi:sodium-dependent phosphate cotransporter
MKMAQDHDQVRAKPPTATEGGCLETIVRLILLLGVLTLFFLSINLMGAALKALSKSYVTDLLKQATENPVLGLLLGILTTSIIQSSSTTTSITVGLVASGIISLQGAIPIIMGANIGTTVTNTIVSFTHVRRKSEFERALAAGTVHDFFNILAAFVLFPLELLTGYLRHTSEWITQHLVGAEGIHFEGMKALIKPVVHWVMETIPSPTMVLVIALVLLFVSLTLMVKIMRAIFIQKMAKILDRFLFRNAFTAFVVGIVFTVLVQSSSVTTSLIVPLVGAGILTLRQIFPYTLGANIGTTITAFLAAMAIAAGGEEGATLGLTVAIVHLLFNVSGIALIYPIKQVPIRMAEWLGRVVVRKPKRAIWFLVIYFVAHIAPIVFFIFV